MVTRENWKKKINLEHGPLELIKTPQFRKYNVLFWVSIATLAYTQDILSSYVTRASANWGYSAIYLLGWATWAVLTPYIIRIAVRVPLVSPDFTTNALKHLLLAVAFALTIESIESILIMILTATLFDKTSTPDMFATYLIYTFHTRLIIYFLIVAGASALDYFSQKQQFELHASQLEAKLASAQLKALKMQIQPHFLFNTHHAIVGLMSKKDNEKASEMLIRLSDLLRKTLDISEEQLIPLSKEFETVSLYLGIQQVRFNDRLEIDVIAPPHLMNVQVPPFILQPLVENAIKHGFAPHAQTCRIEVAAKEINGRLRMTVHDNGAGLPNGSMIIRGIGIENICSRLRELFGTDYTFAIVNHENKGAIATIEIPLITEPEDEKNQVINKTEEPVKKRSIL